MTKVSTILDWIFRNIGRAPVLQLNGLHVVVAEVVGVLGVLREKKYTSVVMD